MRRPEFAAFFLGGDSPSDHCSPIRCKMKLAAVAALTSGVVLGWHDCWLLIVLQWESHFYSEAASLLWGVELDGPVVLCHPFAKVFHPVAFLAECGHILQHPVIAGEYRQHVIMRGDVDGNISGLGMFECIADDLVQA